MAEVQCNQDVNPLDPNAMENLQKKEQEIREKYQEPENLISLDEINDGMTICGERVRPFSAGVIMILEEIKHPLFTAPESNDDENGEQKIELSDFISLLYILFEESEEKLLTEAENGSLVRQARIWAFSLSPDWLEEASEEALQKVDQFHSKFEVYKGEAEGPEGEKKQPAG
jgi:hypothetical protein